MTNNNNNVNISDVYYNQIKAIKESLLETLNKVEDEVKVLDIDANIFDIDVESFRINLIDL